MSDGDCIHTSSYGYCQHKDCTHYGIQWSTGTTSNNWPLTMDSSYLYPFYNPYYTTFNYNGVPNEIADMIQRVGTEKVKHFLEKELEKIQKEIEEEDE